ncbi:MAG: alpha/beta hydrolase [Inquilinus sp.]|nr:alpha/beta hydrolase [Inquilinus sp.]
MERYQFLGLSQAGFHKVSYTSFQGTGAGAGSLPTLICAHGLTRNGRDFDTLAEALKGDRQVVCPDIVGRGKSDWLPDPALYGYPQYLADMTALIARLDVPAVDWVGTSMGALIGMMLAAQPQSPIRRLVMNDAGPLIPAAALQRIADYVGADPTFLAPDALEIYLRHIHAPFGSLTDQQWAHLTEHSARRRDDGMIGLAYDAGIGQAFAGEITDVDLWPVWDRVNCPVLVLRGAESDLLTPEIAGQMQTRGPKTLVVEMPGCGHAPALMADDQIAVVREWLDA